MPGRPAPAAPPRAPRHRHCAASMGRAPRARSSGQEWDTAPIAGAGTAAARADSFMVQRRGGETGGLLGTHL